MDTFAVIIASSLLLLIGAIITGVAFWHCLRNPQLTKKGRRHFAMLVGLVPVLGAFLYYQRIMTSKRRRHQETGRHGRRWAKTHRLAH